MSTTTTTERDRRLETLPDEVPKPVYDEGSITGSVPSVGREGTLAGEQTTGPYPTQETERAGTLAGKHTTGPLTERAGTLAGKHTTGSLPTQETEITTTVPTDVKQPLPSTTHIQQELPRAGTTQATREQEERPLPAEPAKEELRPVPSEEIKTEDTEMDRVYKEQVAQMMPDPDNPMDRAYGRGPALFTDEEMETNTTPEVRVMIDRMSSKISELGDVFSNQLADMKKIFNESVIQISKQNRDSEARFKSELDKLNDQMLSMTSTTENQLQGEMQALQEQLKKIESQNALPAPEKKERPTMTEKLKHAASYRFDKLKHELTKST